MKINCFAIILAACTVFVFLSCSDFVRSVAPLIDVIEDDRLTDEQYVDFLAKDIKFKFSNVYDGLTVYAGLLSDEWIANPYIITNGVNYYSIDEAKYLDISFNADIFENLFKYIHEIRFLSQDLIERVDKIVFTDSTVKDRALYTGYFYHGVALFWLASYFGISETEGGSPLDGGAFVPAQSLYTRAINKFQSAIEYAPGEHDKRAAHTAIARCMIVLEKYEDVLVHATSGLQQGDSPVQALYFSDTRSSTNSWYYYGGRGRHVIELDSRFYRYVEEDSAETRRIPLFTFEVDSRVSYFQDKYPNETDPLDFVSWQENELILAELALRAGDEASALIHINTVRDSHGLAPKEKADMQLLTVERDKEFMTLGMRLIDQRRFGIWHLPEGTWQYFPIPQEERDKNPHLK